MVSNHFIELQKDIDNNIWIMIHSGSRNLGKKIADEYHKKAKNLCELWYSQLPTADLAFLPIDSMEGQEYLMAMDFAVNFAHANRQKMIHKIMEILKNTADKYLGGVHVGFEPIINIAHNYARLENHFGKNVWVHRKGATSAKFGENGIIPGSQGTCSYIVEGLGNPDSFTSCSHGAGRKMGRKDAQRRLNLADEIKILDDQGIIHGIRHESDLDEASGAYKDISTIMSEQSDLVKIKTKLWPIGVIKG